MHKVRTEEKDLCNVRYKKSERVRGSECEWISREGLQRKALREARAQAWSVKPDSRKPKRERKRKRGLRVARTKSVRVWESECERTITENRNSV